MGIPAQALFDSDDDGAVFACCFARRRPGREGTDTEASLHDGVSFKGSAAFVAQFAWPAGPLASDRRLVQRGMVELLTESDTLVSFCLGNDPSDDACGEWPQSHVLQAAAPTREALVPELAPVPEPAVSGLACNSLAERQTSKLSDGGSSSVPDHASVTGPSTPSLHTGSWRRRAAKLSTGYESDASDLSDVSDGLTMSTSRLPWVAFPQEWGAQHIRLCPEGAGWRGIGRYAFVHPSEEGVHARVDTFTTTEWLHRRDRESTESRRLRPKPERRSSSSGPEKTRTRSLLPHEKLAFISSELSPGRQTTVYTVHPHGIPVSTALSTASSCTSALRKADAAVEHLEADAGAAAAWARGQPALAERLRPSTAAVGCISRSDSLGGPRRSGVPGSVHDVCVEHSDAVVSAVASGALSSTEALSCRLAAVGARPNPVHALSSDTSTSEFLWDPREAGRGGQNAEVDVALSHVRVPSLDLAAPSGASWADSPSAQLAAADSSSSDGSADAAANGDGAFWEFLQFQLEVDAQVRAAEEECRRTALLEWRKRRQAEREQNGKTAYKRPQRQPLRPRISLPSHLSFRAEPTKSASIGNGSGSVITGSDSGEQPESVRAGTSPRPCELVRGRSPQRARKRVHSLRLESLFHGPPAGDPPWPQPSQESRGAAGIAARRLDPAGAPGIRSAPFVSSRAATLGSLFSGGGGGTGGRAHSMDPRRAGKLEDQRAPWH